MTEWRSVEGDGEDDSQGMYGGAFTGTEKKLGPRAGYKIASSVLDM